MIRFVMSMLLIVIAWPARADLQVYPTRVLFEGKDRSEAVTLRHLGKSETKYRITTVYYNMDENGRLVLSESPEKERDNGSHLVRYSPRIVTLAPNSSQIVRLLLRKPPDLGVGEYRFHLHFATFEEKDSVVVGQDISPDGKVQTMLKAHRAIAIPIVIRHGESHIDMRLSDATYNAEEQSVELSLENMGNRSLYGQAQVYAENRHDEAIAKVLGVTLYGKKRRIVIPKVDLGSQGGPFYVSFHDESSGIAVTEPLKPVVRN